MNACAFKCTCNFDLSGSDLRDDLFSVNTTIHDKTNEWSVGGDFGDECGRMRKTPSTTSSASSSDSQEAAPLPRDRSTRGLQPAQEEIVTVSRHRVSLGRERKVARLLERKPWQQRRAM
jgi:hypothetical protein